MSLLTLYNKPARQEWEPLLQRPSLDLAAIKQQVAPVLAAVRSQGDEALRDYTERFDGYRPENFELPAADWQKAGNHLSAELKAAIDQARDNLASFHEAQRESPRKIETSPGVYCWRKSLPIERVGLYIPGGTAPLFSTVLMLAIPARLAGCRQVVLCTPAKEGQIHPAMAYAAQLAGVQRIFKLGGAQAIAGMAYGSQTLPKVDKIFGPGNQYVTAAKQLVAEDGVAIDMPAGPSEVLVYGEEGSNPAFMAADLLSQAEHGADSQVVFLTPSFQLATAVQDETKRQLAELPRGAIARQALEYSPIIVCQDRQEALEIINAYAPEHLILAHEEAEAMAEGVVNAGSVFLGPYTPEAAGDYASGTNHTLPTNGYARVFGGVSLDSFLKKVTFQQISRQGLQNLGPHIEAMAQAEELEAHRRAVSIRCKKS